MFEHDYSPADRLLHRLALGSPALVELSFDLDQRAVRAVEGAEDAAAGHHVFVTGLARSGTTVILRRLHDSGIFRSLTYRDMPFPLAPNLWARLSGRWRRGGRAAGRAHGDGIDVDADSPEALEEPFWRIHCGGEYIRRDGLMPHEPDEEVIAAFHRYVAAILHGAPPGRVRYLSKNNNSILRLPSLQRAFPHAAFIIPFRHPAVHALSLWRQHAHFCGLQERSPFIRRYMDWLAHHEFGLGHKPFLMDGAPPDHLTPDMPDYWLDLWIRVYRLLAGQHGPGRLLVCHEDLCADPSVWTRLCLRLGMTEAAPARFALPRGRRPGQFDPGRMAVAEALYALLRDLADGTPLPQSQVTSTL
ncbi:MAG: sulfotransferase [Sphingobium sp.]